MALRSLEPVTAPGTGCLLSCEVCLVLERTAALGGPQGTACGGCAWCRAVGRVTPQELEDAGLLRSVIRDSVRDCYAHSGPHLKVEQITQKVWEAFVAPDIRAAMSRLKGRADWMSPAVCAAPEVD